MVAGALFLAGVALYTVGSRQYYKRQARKYAYDDLAHDELGRPLHPERPHKRLSRNEARALAQHRRERRETAGNYAFGKPAEDEPLPAYSRRPPTQLPTWQKRESSQASTKKPLKMLRKRLQGHRSSALVQTNSHAGPVGPPS